MKYNIKFHACTNNIAQIIGNDKVLFTLAFPAPDFGRFSGIFLTKSGRFRRRLYSGRQNAFVVHYSNTRQRTGSIPVRCLCHGFNKPYLILSIAVLSIGRPALYMASHLSKPSTSFLSGAVVTVFASANTLFSR